MPGQQCIDDEILILLVVFRGCASYLRTALLQLHRSYFPALWIRLVVDMV
jgi:hypothetical protein